MKHKTLTNGVLGSWTRAQDGRLPALREDVYREVVYWSTRLILSAMGSNGIKLSGGAPGKPPFGYLQDPSAPTMSEVEDREVWELYECFYNYLTTDIPIDFHRAHQFCQYMRERTDVFYLLKCPVGVTFDSQTMEILAKVFLGETGWDTQVTLFDIWSVDYAALRLHPNQIVLWRHNGPPLRDLLNAWDLLFDRLVGLPIENNNPIDFLVRYGHDFQYPFYTVPTQEQMRNGIGLRIENLHLFPQQDLVAKALAHELGSDGIYTMIIPEMGFACEYGVSQVTDSSFRVDTMVASNTKPYPKWVKIAFPDKRLK